MRRPARALILGIVLGCSFALPTSAATHQKPQAPAVRHFAADVPIVRDAEWGWPLGGFGGLRRHAALHHIPVVFVHGNDVDAADWYPVREDFRAAGWSDQELWALSYDGLGGDNGAATMRTNQAAIDEHREAGGDGVGTVTDDESNVPDLYGFLRMVQDYTGQPRFTIVAHSLGVTLARETLRVHPELRRDLVAFVGIAGPNHGTSLCPPGSEGQLESCDEIAAGTPWLARLNAAGETYAPARWLTVYDGSGEGDPAYAGPTYAQSPRLAGAENLQYPHTYHNDLRVDAPIVRTYRTWIERAERAYLPVLVSAPQAQRRPRVSTGRPRPVNAPHGRLAATGGLPVVSLATALLLGAAVVRRRRAGCGA